MDGVVWFLVGLSAAWLIGRRAGRWYAERRLRVLDAKIEEIQRALDALTGPGR